MKTKSLLLLYLLMISTGLLAQEKQSKGDILFFEYAYRDAIVQYQKEMEGEPLTNQQKLNLADSYHKIRNYKKASESYLEVHKKDSTMSMHHFNKMLQSMAKTSGLERAKAFLATKSTALSEELLENADFNFDLLEADGDINLEFKTFNVNGNSPQSDFSPTFYKGRLLFTSARPQNKRKIYGPSGESYLDIFIARIGAGGDIQNPNPFTSIPNSPFHQATPFFAQKLNTVFYIKSNANGQRLSFDKNGKNALTLGSAEENGEFRFLLRDLSTSFYYPFYEEETAKLYFAANFEDSLGGTDIYYVYTNRGLIMSSPVNLGPRINTPGNEIAPFIFENSLYFSSDVFYGMGGMDIYKSDIGTDAIFSIPINLGKGINSTSDDFGFIIKNNDENGLMGYFSSNREGGKGNDDIYGFLVKEKPGLKTLILRGEVTGINSVNGISKALIKVLDKQNNIIKEVYAKDDGTYRIEIPWQDNSIVLEASKDRYSIFRKTYDQTALAKIQENNVLNIELARLDDLVWKREGQTVIKMNKFFFIRGKYEITPDIAAELDKAVDVVKKFPQIQLRIEAHTDSRGGSATNFRLSQRRADSIKKYLMDKGVPSSNILYSVGYGEDKITNNCKNGVYCLEILHKQNERHLIVVLNYNLLYE